MADGEDAPKPAPYRRREVPPGTRIVPDEERETPKEPDAG